MNIYQIFSTVVKLGSFSAAAKVLHRTPSSISKKMSQLEQQLNTQLFDRTTRTLRVTEAGMLYYRRCSEIASLIASAEEELSGFSSEPGGTITITWPNTLSTSPIVAVLGRFAETYPDIKLSIRVTNEHENLINEEIDFAFRLNPAVDSSMIAIELFRISPILCASPAFLDCNEAPGDISKAANLPLLLLNNASAMQLFRKNLPGLKNLSLAEHHHVNDINALKQMAKQGLGATLLFQHMVRQELDEGSLVELMPQHEFASLPVYLMYHQYSHIPRKLSLFINYLKDHYLGNQK